MPDTKILGDQPAFPFAVQNYEPCAGLTKREWFAGLAIQGLLSNPSMIDNCTGASVQYIITHAVTFADALIAELERTKPDAKRELRLNYAPPNDPDLLQALEVLDGPDA